MNYEKQTPSESSFVDLIDQCESSYKIKENKVQEWKRELDELKSTIQKKDNEIETLKGRNQELESIVDSSIDKAKESSIGMEEQDHWYFLFNKVTNTLENNFNKIEKNHVNLLEEVSNKLFIVSRTLREKEDKFQEAKMNTKKLLQICSKLSQEKWDLKTELDLLNDEAQECYARVKQMHQEREEEKMEYARLLQDTRIKYEQQIVQITSQYAKRRSRK